MMTNDQRQQKVKCRVPLPLWPDVGLFTNVSVICISQTFHIIILQLISDSGKNDYEITVKEALHMKFKKPTINRQLFTQGISLVLK